MGEDLLRKKDEQFIRVRNRSFERQKELHLFSNVAPDQTTEVIGERCTETAELEPGVRVWPQVEPDGTVAFFVGSLRCVEIPSDRAEAVREFLEGDHVVGEVKSLDSDLDLATVKLVRLPRGDEE